MGKLVFIPSYNDCKQAYKLYTQAAKYQEIDDILIIDDSDTPECIDYYKKDSEPKLHVMHGKRLGKWSAWKQALQIAENYDGLIQIDADVEISSFTPILKALENNAIVTTRVRFRQGKGNSWVAKKLTEVYRRVHDQSWRMGKINMGGQVIALSCETVKRLNHHGFFNEPVRADDYVVALATKCMGLPFTTVDSGVLVTLPGNTREWIRYKSRHAGAVEWARRYVKEKLGDSKAVDETSNTDYKMTIRIFIENCIRTSPVTILIFLLLSLSALLPLEDKSKWRPLESTKLYGKD